MKTILRTAWLGLLTMILNLNANACVDYHPDSIVVNLLVDTLECNYILEVSNLNMFGGNPNDFCSCGITNSIPEGSDISWVAFVDAETNEPLEGFDLFQFSSAAGDSWENADTGSIDWNGFVSEVNSAGIVSGQNVNLWIILDVDPSSEQWGWICGTDEGNLYEMFGSFSIGTDEWDDENQTLAASHQDISQLWGADPFTITSISHDEFLSYISILENFYNGVEEFGADLEVSIYPNPASETVHVSSKTPVTEVVLRNVLGEEIPLEGDQLEVIQIAHLPKGMYMLEVITKKGSLIKKLEIAL